MQYSANGIMTRRSARIKSFAPSFDLANMAAREPLADDVAAGNSGHLVR